MKFFSKILTACAAAGKFHHRAQSQVLPLAAADACGPPGAQPD